MSNQISALMDGELDAVEADSLLIAIRKNQALRQNWDDYHLIGDVLRQSTVTSSDLADKIAACLKNEPTILAPHKSAPRKREYIAWSAAASFAAVAIVALASLKFSATSENHDALSAQSNSAINTVATAQSNPNLNEYLVAHQEFSPGTALLASANFEQATYTQRQESAR